MHRLVNNATPKQGVIIRKTQHEYRVWSGETCSDCTLSGRLKKSSATDPIVVGDVVLWNEEAQITEVLPRRNWLSRRGAVPMPTAHAHEQVIVANVDQVVLVFAVAQPRLAWTLLDRYLVCAEAAGIPALICLTKMDLVE